MTDVKTIAFVGDSYAILNDVTVQTSMKAVYCQGVAGLPIVDAETLKLLTATKPFRVAFWSPCTEMQGWSRSDEILALRSLPPEKRLLQFKGGDRYGPKAYELSNLASSKRDEFARTRSQLLDFYLEQIDFYLCAYPSIKLFPLALRWYGARQPQWLVQERNAWAEVKVKFFDRCLDLDQLLADPGNFQDEQGHLSYQGWEVVKKLFVANL